MISLAAHVKDPPSERALLLLDRIEASNNDQSIGAELKTRLAAVKEGKILECNCNKTDKTGRMVGSPFI